MVLGNLLGKSMLRVILVNIALLFAFNISPSYGNENISIEVPDSWVSIPNEVLNEYSEVIHQMAPNSEKQIYDYGYQLKSSENWLVHPYILVQVKNSGRVPESKLSNLERVERKLKEGASKVGGSTDGLVSEVDIQTPIYDETTHVLFSTTTQMVEGIGQVKGLISILLTEKGFINIYAYSRANEFSNYVGQFEDIVRGVKLAPHLQYQSRMTDNLPIISGVDVEELFIGGIDWLQVLIAGLVGGLIAVGGSMYKRKKAPNKSN